MLLLSQLRGSVAERLLSPVQQILVARQPTHTVTPIEPLENANPLLRRATQVPAAHGNGQCARAAW